MKNKELKEFIHNNVYQNTSTGYVLTPSELAVEMIQTLPKSVFKSDSSTFLDPICKSGTFLFEIVEELYEEGHPIKNIESRVFTIDSNSHSLNVANSSIKKILNKLSGSFKIDYKYEFIERYYNRLIFSISNGKYTTFDEFLSIIMVDKINKNLMKELQKSISDFIGQYEKVSKLESKLFGEVFTPRQLIDEMLDTLPEDVWKNKDLKWLDPAVGIGNFPAAILDRLMVGLNSIIPNEDERRKHILEEMIYFCDISVKNLFLLYMLFDKNNEFKLNVYRGSFLTEEFDKHMKEVWKLEGFDVVVGNPPYQDSDKNNTSVSLWIPFTQKSIILSKEYILFITPINWLNIGLSKYSHMREHNISNIFIFDKKNSPFNNIGIEVGYFLINKNLNFNQSTIINNENIINLNEYSSLPKNIYDSNSLKIWNKFFSNSEKLGISRKDQVHTQRKELWSTIKSDIYCHKTYVSKSKDMVIWSNVIKSNFEQLKVMIPESMSHKKCFMDKNCNISQSIFYKIVDDENMGNNLITFIKSKLFTYIIEVSKWTPALPQSTLENIPKIDLCKSWTDIELYEYFNLTQEEIDLIEKTIKDQ
jgi:hypothetical protein